MTENTKKVVVIGDGYVGKTCFVSKITEGKFINNYHVTIGGWQLRAINPVTGGCGTGVKISALGDTLTSHSTCPLEGKKFVAAIIDQVEYGVKVFKRNGNEVRLCLWDIAGQDPFRSLMPQFGRGSTAAIVMCDVTRRETLEGAKTWKQSVDSTVFLPNGQPIPCILMANKYDLPKTQRQLTSEEMLKFSRDNGFIRFFETSVKDGTNINEALEFLVDKIISYEEDGHLASMNYDDDAIALSRTYSQGKKQHSACCSGD